MCKLWSSVHSSQFTVHSSQFIDSYETKGYSDDVKRTCLKMYVNGLGFRGLPKNKLFILKNNNHSRSVGGRGRWLPPPSNFVVELILYIINQVFLCKCIWN
jgi:hypothetical protein